MSRNGWPLVTGVYEKMRGFHRISGEQLQDEIYDETGTPVTYRLRQARKDRKHLVVVFSGVSAARHDAYGFDGHALDHVPSAVLWIADSFGGSNAYYMCQHLTFEIESAVVALIDNVLFRLGLSREECTLLGASKGGTAALLFGLKYGYRNVIASVPQTMVGSYTRQKLPDTFRFMAGDDDGVAERHLNNYVPDVIRAPYDHDKNIYLISSTADPEYGIHIEPYLQDLERFSNFNLLLTDSALVTSHPEVTPYNVPFILSVLYSLSDNTVPRYGIVTNGNGRNDRIQKTAVPSVTTVKPMARFRWIQIKEDRLTFSGYVLWPGQELPIAPRLAPELHVHGAEYSESAPLTSKIDASVNGDLYSGCFKDYKWSGIEHSPTRGISMVAFPEGEFDLCVNVTSDSGTSAIAPVQMTPSAVPVSSTYGGYHYEVSRHEAAIRVSKTCLTTHIAPDTIFHYSLIKLDGPVLFLSGSFIVPREWMYVWNAGTFAVTLVSRTERITFALAATRLQYSPISHPHKAGAYKWSHFSTPGHKGIDLSSLPETDYIGYVSFVRQGNVYSAPLTFRLTFDGGFSLYPGQSAMVSPSVE